MHLMGREVWYIYSKCISFVITVKITKVIFQLVVISIHPEVGSVSTRIYLKNRTKLSFIPERKKDTNKMSVRHKLIL
jgi:hypothetical protein